MEIKPLVMDESQKEYNQQRVNDLLDDFRVTNLLKQWNLSFNDVVQNLSFFDRYIDYLDNKESYSVPQGYQMVLAYRDGQFSFEYILDQKTQEEEKRKAHLKKYWINHLPIENELLFFRDLNIENEDVSFIDCFEKLIELKINPKPPGLLMFGDVGCGKTYLLSCFSNECAKSGLSVCFVKMPLIISEIKESFQQNYGAQTLMSKMKNCDVLIIDDIGSENVTKWSRDEILFTILDYRMEQKKLVCCSSNYDFQGLLELYQNASNINDKINGIRLMERLSVLCSFKMLNGTSRRKKALFEIE